MIAKLAAVALAVLFLVALAHPVILAALVALAVAAVAGVWGGIAIKVRAEGRPYLYRQAGVIH